MLVFLINKANFIVITLKIQTNESMENQSIKKRCIDLLKKINKMIWKSIINDWKEFQDNLKSNKIHQRSSFYNNWFNQKSFKIDQKSLKSIQDNLKNQSKIKS